MWRKCDTKYVCVCGFVLSCLTAGPSLSSVLVFLSPFRRPVAAASVPDITHMLSDIFHVSSFNFTEEISRSSCLDNTREIQ